MDKRKKNGFTLLELSIVLIIIGLVIGGILMSGDLIRGSEIRATVSQIEKLDQAFNTFRVKYGGLPGDLPTASQLGFISNPFGVYVPSVRNIPSEPENKAFAALMSFLITDAYAQLPPPLTLDLNSVNGNGDGMLGWQEGMNAQYILWQAQLLPNLDPASQLTRLATRNSISPTTHKPALWISMYFTPPSGAGHSLSKRGHYYWTSSDYAYGVTGGTPGASTLLPIESYSIDAKVDDGLPRSGKVLAASFDTIPTEMGDGPSFDASSDTGAAGLASNVCVTNESVSRYNIANISRATGSLCNLTVKAGF